MTHSTRRGAAAVALAAALLAGCKLPEKGPETPDAGPLPPGTHALAAGARLPAPPVTAQCYSPPVRIVFHSAFEWESYWQGNNALCTAPPVPPGIDFAKEMMVYVSIGKRMSPRDSISIDGSGVRNDSLIVVVRRYTLKDGCPGARRATYPQS
ncbi:MAG TPA: hypothetical protein VGO40_00010, partial [Longimicrobium sp.]|nr:hypothetical protein [Longimicrobium sp.]